MSKNKNWRRKTSTGRSSKWDNISVQVLIQSDSNDGFEKHAKVIWKPLNLPYNLDLNHLNLTTNQHLFELQRASPALLGIILGSKLYEEQWKYAGGSA
jgi:hypothetical protein